MPKTIDIVRVRAKNIVTTFTTRSNWFRSGISFFMQLTPGILFVQLVQNIVHHNVATLWGKLRFLHVLHDDK